MRAIQKIIMQGNSAMIVIPRALLFDLELVPGEWVEVRRVKGEDFATIRPFRTGDVVGRSPGIVPSTPEVPR